ncbi:uncharacterized protein LOC110226122 [Arabidopsis lyrata subsp. lyrata]|uniref:uncharacterized protein LOC110226122 n=1 Tax=Arabidopsis lyrata subsp. lyrata TaxID=81972 RepID=UPI000A29C6F9|nr:uncharacterized protein LOC110226122 [Arabidopsis lyrata subsp. lyrata]|eukprot:XP_020872418.1 uncharacterized protein LOC110226122 [Arabidopsis lyrata subsp. lyrata]
MNQQLTKPVSEEEIFKALAAMNVDKAPGPDGFNAGFYKYHWNTIKSGVVNFVKYFFQSGNLDPDINHTYICLVPKIESPTQVKDFRPISLCNIAYKLISKVMAERLKPWLHCLISEFQSAFIPGRLITDNVIITHELLHSLCTKKVKSPFMALKLDIAKAFDKVEWNYLLSILRRLGFAERWCQWIMKCVTTVTYSVLINGSPSKKIIPSRGLRQGDPLSPYLYLLCTEGLSSLLANAVHLKSIHGFKASRNGPAVSHMFFADDSLLFCQANEQDCHQVLQLLQTYATASGQHINFQKSAILFGKNVPSTTQKAIKSLTGIDKIGGFGRYLGLPEVVGRNKYDAFAYISQRVQHKLDNWYNQFLSQAGKEVLIKSVATALPTYTMSCFLLPKRLISQITAQIRRFWWSSIKDKQKIPWVAWSKLTMMKQYGGMGFRDLSHFNIALLAKQSWRLLKEPQSLLSRVLKAKYFPKASLLEATAGHRPSHAWRSIVQVSGLMKPGTSSWDDEKLQEIICPQDTQLIRRIRLRLLKGPDIPTWIFTKDGQYTVKSGYHQLSKPHPYCSTVSAQLQGLCKKIWALHLPPKLKHFWWRMLHNAIHVAANIARRRIQISPDCLFCGDAAETVPHLFFQCRLAKEIWELSPLQISSGQYEEASLFDIISGLLQSRGAGESKESLFPYIGWRIWKARNDLLYNHKRWAIPDIIRQSIMDFELWKEAQNANIAQNHTHNKGTKLQNQQRPYDRPANSFFSCYTDGSWLDPNSRAGIGWALFNEKGRCILKGSSSIDPTNSALEAEAIALREALFQIKRLNYQNVTFYGDSSTLYNYLEESATQNQRNPGPLEIQGYLEDILAMAKSSYDFKCVGRQVNTIADTLARKARQQNLPFVISWIH